MADDEPRALRVGNVRCGVDLVDVERFRDVLARRRAGVAARLFTDAERAECERRADPAQSLAARFAAKEALRKALGRPIAWHDIEIRSAGSGAPVLALSPSVRAADGAAPASGTVSLTHDAGLAVAVVTLTI